MMWGTVKGVIRGVPWDGIIRTHFKQYHQGAVPSGGSIMGSQHHGEPASWRCSTMRDLLRAQLLHILSF